MKTLIAMSIALASSSAFAASPTFVCTLKGQDANNIGDKINVNLTSKTSIRIEGGDSLNGVSGKLDKTYKPRAIHEGSTRYILKTNCDGAGTSAAILDKSMSNGESGALTFSIDCDSDGGGPSFEVYSCEK